MVLGMTRLSFYLSHLINGCIKLVIILFIFSLPLAFFLKVFKMVSTKLIICF
jgi:hypothetical protein